MTIKVHQQLEKAMKKPWIKVYHQLEKAMKKRFTGQSTELWNEKDSMAR
jgi:hypothetical protein